MSFIDNPSHGLRKIVCLHQSAELYGSDRSFLSVIKLLTQQPTLDLKVVLPCHGPLIDLLVPLGINPIIIHGGVIRKKEVKANPLCFTWNCIRSFLKLRKVMKNSDIIYVNTIVYISAYLAGASFISKKQRWAHIRESPPSYLSGLFLFFFVLDDTSVSIILFIQKKHSRTRMAQLFIMGYLYHRNLCCLHLVKRMVLSGYC